MPDVFADPVGVPGPQQHRDRAERVRNRGDQSHLDQGQPQPEGLLEAGDDRRQEEGQRVQPVGDAEVDDGQSPDSRAGQGSAQREVVFAGDVALFGCKGRDEPGPLVVGQPVRIRGSVGEVEPTDDAEQHRGQPDADHHEPPAGQAESAVPGLDQPGGQRCSDRRSRRDGQHEHPHDAGAVCGGEPLAQVEHDAGKQPGFGDAEQESQPQQGCGVRGEGDSHRDGAPRDGDAGQPATSPEPDQGEVGWNLDQDIADEEDPGSQAEHRCRQLQVGAHLGFGDPQIGAVEIVDEVQRHQQRNQPHRDPAKRPGFGRLPHRRYRHYGSP